MIVALNFRTLSNKSLRYQTHTTHVQKIRNFGRFC